MRFASEGEFGVPDVHTVFQGATGSGQDKDQHWQPHPRLYRSDLTFRVWSLLTHEPTPTIHLYECLPAPPHPLATCLQGLLS